MPTKEQWEKNAIDQFGSIEAAKEHMRMLGIAGGSKKVKKGYAMHPDLARKHGKKYGRKKK